MPYKPREVLKKLKAAGFVEMSQKGSHLRLRHSDGRLTFLPMHPKTMGRGIFLTILKQAGLTEQQFREL